jgi:hypothetical protein
VSERSSRQIAGAKVHLPIKNAHGFARRAWTRLCASFQDYRQRSAEALLYMELSQLSDAALKRRGLARDSLYRHVSEMGQH